MEREERKREKGRKTDIIFHSIFVHFENVHNKLLALTMLC